MVKPQNSSPFLDASGFTKESNVAVSVSATGLKGEAWHGYPTDTLDLSARLRSSGCGHIFPHIIVEGSCFWFCTPVRARLLRRPPSSPHTTYSHTQLPNTQLTNTQLTHTQLTHTHTHSLLTRTTYTPLTHTPLTHTQLTHT